MRAIDWGVMEIYDLYNTASVDHYSTQELCEATEIILKRVIFMAVQEAFDANR